MASDPFDKLDSGVLDVLYWRARHLKYEAIAAEIGFKHITVRKRMLRAREATGLFDESKLLAAFIEWNQRTKRYPKGILSPESVDFPQSGSAPLPREERSASLSLRDATTDLPQVPPFLTTEVRPSVEEGKRHHDLIKRLALIVLIALGLVIIAAATRPIMETISDWGRSIYLRLHSNP